MKMPNLELASHFLDAVPKDKCFSCEDGFIFTNLEDLAGGLNSMKVATFKYHVNSEKNDFCTWVYDVIGDIDLANTLRSCKEKKAAAKLVRKRIDDLKKLVRKP